MMNVKALQKTLGVAVDGSAGPVTWRAFFRRCGANGMRAPELARAAVDLFDEYGITSNDMRFAHFMAQVCHETAGFIYMEEIASGAAYEGRKDLGNVKPGDGKLFKGRGSIQITGRDNYRIYGAAIGIDLEGNPYRAAEPYVGMWLALEYWKRHGLNAFADVDSIERITRAINGGTNGLADRKAWLARIRGWIA